MRGEAPEPRVPAQVAADKGQAPAVIGDGDGGRWGDGPDSVNPSDDPVAIALEGQFDSEFDRVFVCESGGGAEVAQRRRRILLSKSIIAQGDFQREAVPEGWGRRRRTRQGASCLESMIARGDS